MRFTWKMIFCVTILLALALSVSGYAVVHRTLESTLKQQVQNSQQDLRIFSVIIQTTAQNDLTLYTKSNTSFFEKLLLNNSVFQSSYYIWDGKGNPLLRSGDMPKDLKPWKNDGSMKTGYVTNAETTLLVSEQPLTLAGNEYVVAVGRDVSSVFADANANLNSYQFIMVIILVVGGALTTAFTFVLTRPIRRISRTARQLAQGHLEKRVNARGNDELQLLAQDFNTMADSLQTKMAELSDALQRQKEFTASFAHELKTPLTSVIGYADTLRSRILPKKQQLDAANYIFHEGKRLEAMSFALLDLFALERKTPAFSEVQIELIAQQVAQSCQYLAERDGIEIIVNAQKSRIFASAELLKTLLFNLMDNARKASQQDGKIILHGERTQEGYLLCVRDYGCGMEQTELSRITEAFYMVNKSRARAQGGAGLGLALCQKIAELHKSNLRFESEPGRGTCVSFELNDALLRAEYLGGGDE